MCLAERFVAYLFFFFQPVRKIARSPTGSKRLLEQFHVCPLLFREKMGVSSDIGRGDLPTTRPVYKYIFSCPGQAQALVRKQMLYFVRSKYHYVPKYKNRFHSILM